MRPAVSVGLLLLAASAPAAPPPKYDEEKLPYRVQWGSYTLLVEKAGKEGFAPERARILDEGGKLLREIRDQRITGIEFPEMNGGGTPELAVEAYSGGAHCCSTQYYFTQDGGLKNLLIFDGRNYGVSELKDLNGDGRVEVIADSDVLAYWHGLSFAGSPSITMVIGWDGSRYVDQTRRYPERSRKEAGQYRSEFLKVLKSKGEGAEDGRRAAAIGYYCNSLAIGEGPAARAWLLARMPTATRRWFLAGEKELRGTIAESRRKIRVSQAAVLKPAE